jgi:hypothetical protein
LEHEAEAAYLDAMAQFSADSAKTLVAKRSLEVADASQAPTSGTRTIGRGERPGSLIRKT